MTDTTVQDTSSDLAKKVRKDSISPQLRMDGVLANVITGMGTAQDKTTSNCVKHRRMLSKIERENLFLNWMINRICTAYPNESTRKWLEHSFGDATKKNLKESQVATNVELKEKFSEYEKRLDVRGAVRRATTWANLYRGAAIVPIIEDGLLPMEPLDPSKIKSIRSLEVLDGYKIRPEVGIANDIEKPKYYNLVLGAYTNSNLQEYIRNLGDQFVTTANGNISYRIHPSRVIPFHGFELPPDMKTYNWSADNYGWGGSVIDLVWDAFNRYEMVHQSAAAMVADFNIFTYSMKGLGTLISEGEEKEIGRRIQLLQQSMSVLGGIIMDADDEKAEFISRRFQGLPELMDKFREPILGGSGIPHTILFQEAAGGTLGATGESEANTWANLVNVFQETKIRPKAEEIFTMMWMAKDSPTRGKMPEDWDFQFKPLIVQSQSDIIADRSAQMAMDVQGVNSGILLPEEVRESRYSGDEYSFDTTIDKELYKKKQEEAEQQAGGFDLSQFDFGNEEEAPQEAQQEEEQTEEPRQDSAQSIRPGIARIVNREAAKKFRRQDSTYAKLWKQNKIKQLMEKAA